MIRFILYQCGQCGYFFLRELDPKKKEFEIKKYICKHDMYEMKVTYVRDEDIRGE